MRGISQLGKRLANVMVFCLVAMMPVPSLHAQNAEKEKIRALTVESGNSFLGIEMEDVTADNAASYKLSSEKGVIVRSVEKGSPAETASLQAKDVILEYAGMPVFSSAQFGRMVRETPAGRKVDLVVSRDGKKLNLTARIGEKERGSGIIGRGFNLGPDERVWRNFRFDGPDGRGFEFHTPGGPGNTFVMPRPGTVMRAPGKPRLGVTLEPVSPQMAEFLGVAGKKGLLVTSVMENTPAVGKLKAGDVIIRADDRSVENPEDLTQLLAKKESEAKVELRIVRDKKEQTITVDLARLESPAKRGRGYSM